MAPEQQEEDPKVRKAKARHTDVTVVFYKRIDAGTDPVWLAEQKRQWTDTWGSDSDFQAEVVDAGRLPVLAIVFESQTGIDKQKWARWAEYVTGVRGKYKCPADLVPFCFDQATAKWAARPIPLTGLDPPTILYPKVIGPNTIALSTQFTVTTPCANQQTADARKAGLVILAAFAHLRDPAIVDYFPDFFQALEVFDQSHLELYYEELRKGLDESLQQQFDMYTETYFQENKNMKPFLEPESPFGKAIRARYLEGEQAGRAEGKAEGKVEGEADALLTVLDLRDVPVDDRARETITSCTDLGQLKNWLARALTATDVGDVFA